MEKKSYAVVIRTLGNGGDKYRQLINSILNQTILPDEIIVVIPEGYNPDYVSGKERIIYSEKGMVIQRAVGIQAATSDYILVVDDDVAFNSNFIKDIFYEIESTNADVIVPAEEMDINSCQNLNGFLKSFAQNFKYVFIGQRFIMLNRLYRVKFAATGTCSINLNIDKTRKYKTQSWTFQCFFMKTDKAKTVRIEDERWLERVGYAIYDDQVFAYKSLQQGDKAIYIPAITYSHLDGGTGHANAIDNVSRLKRKLYANTFNRTVFWNKFMYKQATVLRKIWLIIWYAYATFNTFILYLIYSLFRKGYNNVPFQVIKGAMDGFQFKNK